MNNEPPPLTSTLVYWRRGHKQIDECQDQPDLVQTKQCAYLLLGLMERGELFIESVTLPNGSVLSGYTAVRAWVQGDAAGGSIVASEPQQLL